MNNVKEDLIDENWIFPYSSKNNKYISIVIECLRNSGIEVYDYDNLKKINKKKLKTLEVVNLNWYESTIQSKGTILTIFRMIIKTIELLYLKLSGIKIIYTMHNKIPHDNKGGSIFKIFIKGICKISDKIVILSKGTKDILLEYISLKEIENKVCYIPHPNYIGVYEEKKIDYTSILNIKKGELVLLFMGAVRPYKNVELLIEASKNFENKSIKFIIAGNPSDDEYKNKILDLIDSKSNIIPMLYFIEDDEITSLIEACDLMIFPYDMNSSLNSGSIILSFSYGKSVISPLISTLQDFDDNLFFSYTYETADEHKKQLIEQIEMAYEIYMENPGKLKKMGSKLKENVMIENSVEVIQNKYIELYNALKRVKG